LVPYRGVGCRLQTPIGDVFGGVPFRDKPACQRRR